MDYLTTAFSPMMLGKDCRAEVQECRLVDIRMVAPVATSMVAHEATAKILSVLLETPIEFRREKITLDVGDIVYVIIPAFRAEVAREFTREEVEAAGFRCFYVRVRH